MEQGANKRKSPEPNGVLIKNKTSCCEHDGCNIVACFGFKGKPKKQRRCKLHKTVGMVQVVTGGNKRKSPEPNGPLIKNCCEHDGCNVQASFGFKEGGESKKRSRCNLHKTAGMVRVVTGHHSTCKHANCSKSRTYGFPDSIREFCQPHALIGMVQLTKNQLCKHEQCSKSVSYGFPEGKREYCKPHALLGMVNITRYKKGSIILPPKKEQWLLVEGKAVINVSKTLEDTQPKTLHEVTALVQNLNGLVKDNLDARCKIKKQPITYRHRNRNARGEKYTVSCRLPASIQASQPQECKYRLTLKPQAIDEWIVAQNSSSLQHTCSALSHLKTANALSFSSPTRNVMSFESPQSQIQHTATITPSPGPATSLLSPVPARRELSNENIPSSPGPAINFLSPVPASRRQLCDEQTAGGKLIRNQSNPVVWFHNKDVMQAFNNIKETLAKILFTKRSGTYGMVSFADVKELYLEELSRTNSPTVNAHYRFLIPKVLKMYGEVEAQKLPQKFGSGVLFAANLNREEYSNALAQHFITMTEGKPLELRTSGRKIDDSSWNLKDIAPEFASEVKKKLDDLSAEIRGTCEIKTGNTKVVLTM